MSCNDDLSLDAYIKAYFSKVYRWQMDDNYSIIWCHYFLEVSWARFSKTLSGLLYFQHFSRIFLICRCQNSSSELVQVKPRQYDRSAWAEEQYPIDEIGSRHIVSTGWSRRQWFHRDFLICRIEIFEDFLYAIIHVSDCTNLYLYIIRQYLCLQYIKRLYSSLLN